MLCVVKQVMMVTLQREFGPTLTKPLEKYAKEASYVPMFLSSMAKQWPRLCMQCKHVLRTLVSLQCYHTTTNMGIRMCEQDLLRVSTASKERLLLQSQAGATELAYGGLDPVAPI